MAAYAGLKWVGIELEEKFVRMANQNFEMHEYPCRTMGFSLPVIILGDTRRLSEIIGQADIVATSPPFLDSLSDHSKVAFSEITGNCHRKAGHKSPSETGDDYGTTPGQIGAMKAGSIDAVCTSPPYAESIQSQDHGIDWTKAGPATGNRKRGEGTKHEETLRAQLNYSGDPQNIGNLRAGDVAAVVTSPPYEGTNIGNNDAENELKRIQKKAAAGKLTGEHLRLAQQGRLSPHEQAAWESYGKTDGQIGNEVSDTYWEACAQVYRECHKILKPGGVIVVVVKSYVKAGRRVPLPMQTLKLLIHLGFTPLERIKAMLVKETVTPGLFGEVRKLKERKSFFRRLAEKKGSPRIDFEEVLICRRNYE